MKLGLSDPERLALLLSGRVVAEGLVQVTTFVVVAVSA
jgi:hypothetical protein